MWWIPSLLLFCPSLHTSTSGLRRLGSCCTTPPTPENKKLHVSRGRTDNSRRRFASIICGEQRRCVTLCRRSLRRRPVVCGGFEFNFIFCFVAGRSRSKGENNNNNNNPNNTGKAVAQPLLQPQCHCAVSAVPTHRCWARTIHNAADWR